MSLKSVEKHLVFALSTFVASAVPQLLAVHGHVDRSLLLSLIPSAIVPALVVLFPGEAKAIEGAAAEAVKAAK